MAPDKLMTYLLPVAERLEVLFPDMKRKLVQARMDDVDPVEHIAEALFRGLNTGAMVATALIVFWVLNDDPSMLNMALMLGPGAAGFAFFTYAKLPNVKARKRVRKLEKELPYALRHILIEVKAGISLYEAMVSVSEGYGEASVEFRQIVKDINAGTSEIEALERAVVRNPSLQFRRALWQMINALKSGSDVSKTLESLVKAVVEKQILEVRKYGKSLNPYTLMYMMVAVIVPSLGVTFLMVLSTFTGANISQNIFLTILAVLIIFQLVFINIVKSKRPQVKA